MKYVKLFENWANSTTKKKDYKNPNVKFIGNTKTLYHEDVQNVIHELFLFFNNDTEVSPDEFKDLRCNFVSFSDYNFWNDYYEKITVNQEDCRYKLIDCFGIPLSKELILQNTNIRSMAGLDEGGRNYNKLYTVQSKLENLNHLPPTKKLLLKNNPLLSYYGLNSTETSISDINDVLCFRKYLTLYKDMNDIKSESPELHANVFCLFQNDKTMSNNQFFGDFNPWIQIYEDPNEVENYDFLFLPFYFSSELFRNKVQEYLPYADLTDIVPPETELW